MLAQLISVARAAACDQHRALILLTSPPEGALSNFAAMHQLPFIGAVHAADRADRITEILGSEFDILVHETHDHIDAGLLAALSGTIKAGGILILAVPFPHPENKSTSSLNHFNRRFARLLSEMVDRFPTKVQWLNPIVSAEALKKMSTSERLGIWSDTTQPGQAAAEKNDSALSRKTAHQEQNALLKSACDYLNDHSRGCITITGRRGRGKSALLGKIASWLNEQDITFAVTTARRSALTSLQRHSSAHCDFLAPADAQRSGCQVLLVDEASSLPLSLLESYLDTHQHVIYCSTVEGYENAGRAFALRFAHLLKKRYAHALALQPDTPWRWDAGDPLEHLIDTLLMGGNSDSAQPPPLATEQTVAACQTHWVTDKNHSPSAGSIHLLDRAALAFDEPLLRQVYGLLRDSHYQTSATDLSHMLDAPDLQLWILEEKGRVKAALMLVLEGDIEACLHEAIVSKKRRLPHQLLPQLLAQSANEAPALAVKYARVIRIAVAKPDRRHGLGSRLLQAVECAIVTHGGADYSFGASFASDPGNLAFWLQNGYTLFHTGFKPNPRTGRAAVAVIKSQNPILDSIVQSAVSIHDDNLQWTHGNPQKPDSHLKDAELLQRFVKGQRSVHDTFAALSRLASVRQLPLQHRPDIARRRYEAVLREAVAAVLK